MIGPQFTARVQPLHRTASTVRPLLYQNPKTVFRTPNLHRTASHETWLRIPRKRCNVTVT